MKHACRLFATLSAVALMSGALGARPASATNVFDPTLDTCTTFNCGAINFSGTVLLSSTFAMPWTVQIAARQNECLRIDVLTQDVDLEAVLVAPNGTVWRDNDRDKTLPITDRRPLIKVRGIPQNGWYTLQLSQQAGLPVNADFNVSIGRYNLFNPNCNSPTPAIF